MVSTLYKKTGLARSLSAVVLVLTAAAGLDPLGAGPASAQAGWPRPRLGFELASVHFTPYVDFLSFREGVPESGIPDRPESRLLEADDTDFTGFSLGLALHPDLEFTWTRHTGSSALRYTVDGTERISGEMDDFGVTIQLPDFDYTLQTFSLRWAPERARWRGRLGPTVGLGWGRIEQQQQGTLNLEGRPVQWGETDAVVETMIGTEFRGPWVRAGIDLRLQRWRFEPETETFPTETVYARMLIGWVRVAF